MVSTTHRQDSGRLSTDVGPKSRASACTDFGARILCSFVDHTHKGGVASHPSPRCVVVVVICCVQNHTTPDARSSLPRACVLRSRRQRMTYIIHACVAPLRQHTTRAARRLDAAIFLILLSVYPYHNCRDGIAVGSRMRHHPPSTDKDTWLTFLGRAYRITPENALVAQ